MPETLRLAFVGCGAIARYHLDGIREHAPRIEVTAAVDLDAQKAQSYAEETGATAFTSLEEALEKGEFDAVDLMLPHDLHEAAATQCFAAGKHVLLEKPMSLELASCDRILAAGAEHVSGLNLSPPKEKSREQVFRSRSGKRRGGRLGCRWNIRIITRRPSHVRTHPGLRLHR